MPIFSRKPLKIAGQSTSGKLYQTDHDYLMSRVAAGDFKKIGEALREYVHIGVRVERNTELGKDETMYAVRKKQEMVVHEGTKPLVEKLGHVDDHVREQLDRHGVLINEALASVTERLAMLERQSVRHNQGINRLLEISVVCYGILRHYVLGLFVIRLTKTKFEDYAAGFRKRLSIFLKSVRAGNLLLEDNYEALAEEFAAGISAASSVTMPVTNKDQEAAQREQPPILGQPFDVPLEFPQS